MGRRRQARCHPPKWSPAPLEAPEVIPSGGPAGPDCRTRSQLFVHLGRLPCRCRLHLVPYSKRRRNPGSSRKRLTCDSHQEISPLAHRIRPATLPTHYGEGGSDLVLRQPPSHWISRALGGLSDIKRPHFGHPPDPGRARHTKRPPTLPAYTSYSPAIQSHRSGNTVS